MNKGDAGQQQQTGAKSHDNIGQKRKSAAREHPERMGFRETA